MPAPGAEPIRLLWSALAARFEPSIFRGVGPPPDDEIDAIGWRLATAPRYLFSVSTETGRLPDGLYNLQISIVDESEENGEILFLDDVSLEEACDVTAR